MKNRSVGFPRLGFGQWDLSIGAGGVVKNRSVGSFFDFSQLMYQCGWCSENRSVGSFFDFSQLDFLGWVIYRCGWCSEKSVSGISSVGVRPVGLINWIGAGGVVKNRSVGFITYPQVREFLLRF